jgi:hypothetical protein
VSGCVIVGSSGTAMITLSGYPVQHVKMKDMYLRINSCLCIPVVALQHSGSCSPIDTCEVYELGDGSLLLGRISWRHLVSVTVPSSPLQARSNLELRNHGGVETAKLNSMRGNVRGGRTWGWGDGGSEERR